MESGHRRSKLLGTAVELPTKEAALRKAEITKRDLRLIQKRTVPTVREIVDRFRAEKMSQRFSTRYGYEAWLKNHILPKWGNGSITELRPREVEMWLSSLPLSPKSRVHIRGVLHQLWEFSMWTGDVPIQRNPMELVRVKNATKRTRMKPKSLTVEEFQQFLSQLDGSVRVIALVCVSFGLRISECLALKWGDVDWLNSSLHIQRGIVRQRVGDVKTEGSEQFLSMDQGMKVVLQGRRQETEFPSDEDWMFASPVKIGREPLSYPWIYKEFRTAAKGAGIPVFGTHSLRHTYRSWLDAAGTPIAVQQKLMRHADIRTTMNIYGSVVTDEMKTAQSKVVRMALSGEQKNWENPEN
jgi:integrase